ncbi:MAG: response regulator transcription factor [Christensenellaceae bacterium]|nr:response regulator transcription factor [Christensenellaceae bacterium]
MGNINVLVADDDKNIRELVKLYLQNEGYDVVEARNGENCIEEFGKQDFDLVLLDIMMPVMDGMQTLKEIRKTSNVPVIMLTARGETYDKILGLEFGADDYVVKPFDPKELMARVKAVIRRSTTYEPEENKVLEFKDLTININNYTVEFNGESLKLPPKEMELLYYLASKPNHVFTREQLLEQVWDFNYFGDSRTVDVHVKRLREKLPGNDQWSINTVWGVGYKFEVNE